MVVTATLQDVSQHVIEKKEEDQSLRKVGQGWGQQGRACGLLDPITRTLVGSEDEEDLERRIDLLYSELGSSDRGIDFEAFKIGLKHLPPRRGGAAIHITEDDFAVITDQGALLGPTDRLSKAQFRAMMRAELEGLVEREEKELLAVTVSDIDEGPCRSTRLAMTAMERSVRRKMDVVLSKVAACAPPQMPASVHVPTLSVQGHMLARDGELVRSGVDTPRGTSRTMARRTRGNEVGKVDVEEEDGGGVLRAGSESGGEGHDAAQGILEEMLAEIRHAVDTMKTDIVVELREQRGMQTRLHERLTGVESLVLGQESRLTRAQQLGEEAEVPNLEARDGEASMASMEGNLIRGQAGVSGLGIEESDGTGWVCRVASAGQHCGQGDAEGEREGVGEERDGGDGGKREDSAHPFAAAVDELISSSHGQEVRAARVVGSGTREAHGGGVDEGRKDAMSRCGDGGLGVGGEAVYWSGSEDGAREGSSAGVEGIRRSAESLGKKLGEVGGGQSKLRAGVRRSVSFDGADSHQVLRREHDEVLLQHSSVSASSSAAQTPLDEYRRCCERVVGGGAEWYCFSRRG